MTIELLISLGIMHEDVLDAAWSRGRGEYRSTDEHFTSTSEECCLGLHTVGHMEGVLGIEQCQGPALDRG